MTAEEAKIFESDPLFEAAKQMRRWDENAKYPDLKTPSFESYKDMIYETIVHPKRTAADTLKTCSYIREGNRIVGLR